MPEGQVEGQDVALEERPHRSVHRVEWSAELWRWKGMASHGKRLGVGRGQCGQLVSCLQVQQHGSGAADGGQRLPKRRGEGSEDITPEGNVLRAVAGRAGGRKGGRRNSGSGLMHSGIRGGEL